jgi:hypothetical protein
LAVEQERGLTSFLVVEVFPLPIEFAPNLAVGVGVELYRRVELR